MVRNINLNKAKIVKIQWLFVVGIIILSVSEIGESRIPFEPELEEGNTLGVFTETITNIQRWAHDTKMLTEIKIKYLPEDGLPTLQDICEKNRYAKFSDLPGDEIQYGNCSFSQEWSSMYEYTGLPVYYSYNYTVKQVRLKTFTPQDNENVLCVVDKLRRPKFYASVMRVTIPGLDLTGEMATYKLDQIREQQMGFFEGVIEPELVYQFDTTRDFINRPPLYNCIISLTTSASVENIKKNCPILCVSKKDKKRVRFEEQQHDEL